MLSIVLSTTAKEQSYQVQLIQRRDGTPISDAAKSYLISTGALWDPELNGFVIGDDGMPVSYFVLLPSHGLTVRQVVVDYYPEWFSPPEPAQVFEEISIP